ncbi:hypothetical protein A2686_04905 [Candidatus Woesebacteria bacterium RIFCSPHIGHO2_01_FULL_38_10]|uniref:Uncharacterized protein n=1 Tax=Candidatus Woesebacteria bacterium RIFCSPLOWO2_01_FULL_39_10b TaxID=1802517 RepID=A0A1F8B9I4_9BACT|nr:MAG: hypothetical protein A2686_04905 [Candidatus Woesebacteria bacterium RIFCSPHIGHO2_01_FULL_38_10]OGM60687.1 MAG: hypothetical protein A2892_01430 [Candidatus Woesebacteria bacterium RIFCSPLOWO2_01_FULL_39_10b]
MRRISKHLQHYLPLLGILSAGVFGFTVFSYDKIFQIILAISTACAYVSWGIIHHHIHKDLHLSVIIEYLVIAFLGLTIIYSVLLRV